MSLRNNLGNARDKIYDLLTAKRPFSKAQLHFCYQSVDKFRLRSSSFNKAKQKRKLVLTPVVLKKEPRQ